jgi:hypothetical protein
MYMYTDTNIYYSLWSKYRPAILQLMRASANEAQQYKLSAHEFKAVGDKSKSGFTFSLETLGGKASNNVAGSAVAKDLLLVLQKSKTGAVLLNEAPFELRLDKQFVLHVSRKPEAAQPEESPA